MAPLPPSNTPRFRLHYHSMGHPHTMQFRSHSSPAAMGTFIAGFLNSFQAGYAPLSVDFVDFAPAGSDIFNIVTTGIEGNIYGTSTTAPPMQAFAFTFVGRTSGGKRTRLAIFGANALGDNYRYTAGESAIIDTAIAYLQANAANCLGIDNIQPVWKAYANVQVNDHWVKRVR